MKILYCFLLMLSSYGLIFGQDQKDYSTIYIYTSNRSGKVYSAMQYHILFNNVRITGLGAKELLEYKMYSSGQLLVEANGPRISLTVEKGKDYYLDIDFKNIVIKKVDESVGKLFISDEKNYETLITLTEDIRNPIRSDN